MLVDLNNLKNMFVIADCRTNNKHKGLKLVKNTVLNQTLQSFLYKSGKDLVLTFTSYEPTDLKGLWTGVMIWYYQNMVTTPFGSMNQFFHDKSLIFYNDMKEDIQKHFTKHSKGYLYITGISMGGAMSQAFYYHIQPIQKTIITTFGSPRIGDMNLRDWFYSCCKNKLSICNYALFKQFGLCKRVDPVITFPHKDNKQRYVNNSNLIMIYKNILSNNAEYSIDQDDIHITVSHIICNFLVSSELDKYWQEIHNIDEYYNGLPE